MVSSPADALGPHASGVRSLLVEVVRSRHDRFAEGHQISGSRYTLGFSTQWRDLLEDLHEAATKIGFQSYKLTPGGHKIPVINGCLVYLWRVPDNPNAVSKFAASPTRKAGFAAEPPPPMLFEPRFADAVESAEDSPATSETEAIYETVHDTMPVVLVMIWSTPRHLQSIEWAVAVLDDADNVQLSGQECIWEPELVTADVASDVESFDSGTPVSPVVEPHEQEETDPNG
ncbi:hypothetical protein [Nocardia testacea]|uniref:hypothetical protein n=1 Tax=Nocardia testacea TaxID=248551 RepID=UPI0033FC8B1E